MDLSLVIAALIAGALTVLAPCIFSALPIILARGTDDFGRARRVIGGLLVSIFIFTLLLKVSTGLLGIPTSFWQGLSGLIILLVGIGMLWPDLYAKFAHKAGLERLANRSQQAASRKSGNWADYLLGASLGPVFSACSPTYALIVAIILPSDKLEGTIYLLAFLLGLGLVLAGVALGGQKLVRRLNWSLDPYGKFKRISGLVLVIVGILIAFGWERDLLTEFVENGWYDWQLRLEEGLVN